MLLAADYYIEKEDLFIVGEDQKIRLVSLWSVVIQSTSVYRNDLSKIHYTGSLQTDSRLGLVRASRMWSRSRMSRAS